MEKNYEFDRDVFVLLADYKQAYYWIIGESLWAVMLKSGIPEKTVKLIEKPVLHVDGDDNCDGWTQPR